ncbi:MAG: phage tail protein [Pseudomonadota bacterium]
MPYLFEIWALPHQRPPGGDWKTWVILGGRGAGKTRAGAEWVRTEVEGARPLDPGRSRRMALVAETFEQAREVMVFGDSGIMACSPPDRRPVWQATRRRLEWPNGSVAQLFSAHDPEGLRGPQFDAAWVDEYGCAAIHNGTNQPNKFLDPKSSESSLPRYSNGRRDDFLQQQYLRAMADVWNDPAVNPDATAYAGRMVDMENAHVWAWDTRPYPEFPRRGSLWSDGPNYKRGHWISGRIGAQSLASVVAELCERAGVITYDVSELYGLVRGYSIAQNGSIRAALQPLMLAYGFDAIERNGVLVFRSRSGLLDGGINPETLAVSDELEGLTEHIRVPNAEIAGRIRLNFSEADGDFDVQAVEAIFPDEHSRAVDQTDLPLVLTRSEAREISERWLTESRISRDSVRFALPPSVSGLGAGDVVQLPEEGLSPGRYRIDRVETGSFRQVEATRVERGVYAPVDSDDDIPEGEEFAPDLPVYPLFLDLPLLTGEEVPHAPYLAVSADPWPGGAAVFRSASGNGFSQIATVGGVAVLGETLTDLPRGAPSVIDRGPAVTVQILNGTLSSATREALLNGANLAAIGDGSASNWEVFQFETADLVGEDTYALSGRLRGQAGTEFAVPDIWPAGSKIVLLTPAVRQIPHALALRGLERTYRIGPVSAPYDDESYVETALAFEAAGLRPYAPVHLRIAPDGSDGLGVSWVRRTRVDGDTWQSFEVPLGEASEMYLLRVLSGGSVVREELLSGPGWSYSAAEQLADGVAAPLEIHVAQVSETFGPGPFAKVTYNG